LRGVQHPSLAPQNLQLEWQRFPPRGIRHIVGGIIYGLASWQYRNIIELKDAIARQHATIQNVDASLASLRAENADLRARLATSESAIAQSQRRDPDAIYQLGVEVGRVTGASEDRAASTVTFESIEGGNFDRARNSIIAISR